MNVLYTCDNNYIWIMGISVISLFENNKSLENLKVFLLGENIDQNNKEILLEIASRYGREIIIIDVPKLDIPKSLVSARWPLSAFTRLFAGQLLPYNIDRILYLDCDTIIIGNIKELSKIDISNNTFYGVKDCIGKLYKENIGLDGDDIYINAGVLLINLERLRQINLKQRIDTYMHKYEHLINYADQDILNGIFNEEIGFLNPIYDVMTITLVHTYKEIITLRIPTNYYTFEEIKDSIEKPIIVHYTTNMRTIRPWFVNTNHPMASVFIKYMKLSPWKNKQLQKMNFTSKESKIIEVIQKMPRNISCQILGLIHARIKPLVIRFIALKSFSIKGGNI